MAQIPGSKWLGDKGVVILRRVKPSRMKGEPPILLGVKGSDYESVYLTWGGLRRLRDACNSLLAEKDNSVPKGDAE